MNDLEQIASLLVRRNAIDEKIADLTARPAIRGPVGEWIAHKIFRVTLEEDATKECIDGCFTDGPLAGKTVNVKWYGKREGLLDINPACFPKGLPACLSLREGPNDRGQARQERAPRTVRPTSQNGPAAGRFSPPCAFGFRPGPRLNGDRPPLPR